MALNLLEIHSPIYTPFLNLLNVKVYFFNQVEVPNLLLIPIGGPRPETDILLLRDFAHPHDFHRSHSSLSWNGWIRPATAGSPGCR
jgi:hypothetical protein